WGGEHWGWTDPRALGLVAAAIVLTVVFVLVENRAKEPIVPMRLFRNQIFSVGNAFGFISGLAMFGGVIFLPLYFQGVMGMSPTRSGLAMIPMIGGLLFMSILSGLLITKTGRYKIYPILGAALILVGLFLLAQLEVDTPYWEVAIYALVFGLGLGLTMQTVMVAVQNAVDMRDMGVATSSLTFTRSLGAAIGTAMFGAILNSRLATYLGDAMADSEVGTMRINPEVTSSVQAMQDLEEPARGLVLGAYTHALTDLFLVGVPFVVVALVIALMLKEIPLRSGADMSGPSDKEAAGDGERESSVPAFSGH
ncbi:MAG TPA: MFS transporter, partial [Thermomicrobiales bacterium]|nr:MFS transporter [Thermomicrobiales bacterium]